MLPVLFKVGNFPVHSWGLLLMLGFLLATWRAAKNGYRYKIEPEAALDVALWGLFGGVIGARLVYVALTWKDFAGNPLSLFAIWQGGMTFYGGLFGGILAGVLACRVRKVNVGDMADLAAVSFPIGYALGRVGCFLNGCCYGGHCDIPWLATRFHLPNGQLTEPSHPAQLYSAAAGVAMFLILAQMEKSGRLFRGQLMLVFVFLYSIYRFAIEFVREGVTAQATTIAHLTQAQVASLIFALVVAGWWMLLARRARRGGDVLAAA